MSASELIHLAVDLSHYHTDYLWKMPGSWEGYPYYSSPGFYEDIARMASRGVCGIVMPDYCATTTPSAFLPMRSIAFCAKPEAFMSATKALAYSTTAPGEPFG